MKPDLFSWTLVLLVAFGVTACGAKATDDPNNGGRTHWLKACDDDTECGTYQCIAKLCTLPCTRDRDCQGHGAPASCIDEVCAPVDPPVQPGPDASTSNQNGSCEHDGVVYAHGDDVPLDDCNRCRCDSGEIGCTDRACAEPTPEENQDCERNGVTYAHGTSVPSNDGCGGGCVCSNGRIECLLIDNCPEATPTPTPEENRSCEHNGQTYAHGDGVPSIDGCNRCVCFDGSIQCALEGCPEPTPTPSPGSCYDLDEQSCLLDPLCQVSRGFPVNLEAQCLEPRTFAACASVDRNCDASEIMAFDEAGNCWFFGSSCNDRGFDYSNSAPARCGRNLPMCEDTETPDPDCGSLESNYAEQLDAARACQTDDECVALDGSTPLRCWCDLALNRDADLAALASVGELAELCFNSLPCECSEPATAPARCIANRCTLVPEGDEALCAATGGTWRPNSCGHYHCSEPPACDAIIPGCDCGLVRNFTASGCVTDPACPVATEAQTAL